MRFRLAEAAPICSDPMLREALGYNLATDMADAILAGTYVYPLTLTKQRGKFAKNMHASA